VGGDSITAHEDKMVDPYQAAQRLYETLIKNVGGSIFTHVGELETGEVCIVVYLGKEEADKLQMVPDDWEGVPLVVKPIDVRELVNQL
jgi:hypothetical protein